MNLRALLVVGLLSGGMAKAEVTLPTILSGVTWWCSPGFQPVHVWGWATAGEDVSVTFRGETRTTKAGNLGRWSVYPEAGNSGVVRLS